uniref:Ovule protein n=1 Tax=Parascaris equorum TaxID=6256 RepID=A0A914R4S4_PAREQ
MMIQRIHSITEFLLAWLSLCTPTDIVCKRTTCTSSYFYLLVILPCYIITVFFRLLFRFVV